MRHISIADIRMPKGFKTGGEAYAMKEKPKTTFAMLNRNLQVMVWFSVSKTAQTCISLPTNDSKMQVI